MAGPRDREAHSAATPNRLVRAALRCYPVRWRRRHGEEAAELAALLLRDGTPAASIALSYLTGAAREWLTPRPGRHLRTAVCAMVAVACALGVSAELMASAGPASAASGTGHAHCRPIQHGTVPYRTAAIRDSQMIVWGSLHDQSC